MITHNDQCRYSEQTMAFRQKWICHMCPERYHCQLITRAMRGEEEREEEADQCLARMVNQR